MFVAHLWWFALCVSIRLVDFHQFATRDKKIVLACGLRCHYILVSNAYFYMIIFDNRTDFFFFLIIQNTMFFPHSTLPRSHLSLLALPRQLGGKQCHFSPPPSQLLTSPHFLFDDPKLVLQFKGGWKGRGGFDRPTVTKKLSGGFEGTENV